MSIGSFLANHLYVSRCFDGVDGIRGLGEWESGEVRSCREGKLKESKMESGKPEIDFLSRYLMLGFMGGPCILEIILYRDARSHLDFQ